MAGKLSTWTRRGLLLAVVTAGCGRIDFDAIGVTADGMMGDAVSCATLAPTCGSTGTSPCCESPVVRGGTFYRSYDGVGYNDMGYPATLSTFRLDKYEVTVGRFRQFVNAGIGTQQSPPPSGAGGRTLNGVANQGGWDPAWNSNLPLVSGALITNLKCDATYQTWTDTPGVNENRPIVCITWYEAMAFCIWDGGFLPTEAEWNYAAAGGSKQNAYPWSNPAGDTAIDCGKANFGGPGWPTTACVGAGANDVGATSPSGDGVWGHADLGGNVWEWLLDWYDSPYLSPCDDCANLFAASSRVHRGGSFREDASYLRAANRDDAPASYRDFVLGVRCGRTP